MFCSRESVNRLYLFRKAPYWSVLIHNSLPCKHGFNVYPSPLPWAIYWFDHDLLVFTGFTINIRANLRASITLNRYLPQWEQHAPRQRGRPAFLRLSGLHIYSPYLSQTCLWLSYPNFFCEYPWKCTEYCASMHVKMCTSKKLLLPKIAW